MQVSETGLRDDYRWMTVVDGEDFKVTKYFRWYSDVNSDPEHRVYGCRKSLLEAVRDLAHMRTGDPRAYDKDMLAFIEKTAQEVCA